MSTETMSDMLEAAPPPALPLVGAACLWLFNLAEDGLPVTHCVDGCLTLHYALAEYGIGSRVEAVALELDGCGTHTRYGYEDGPRYNPNGSFNGHAVLVVPGAGRFLDPTLQQFREVPDTEKACLPVMAPLPAGDGLGTTPIGMDRGDHSVLYYPLPEEQAQAWRHPLYEERDAEFREAGANLASNLLEILGIEDLGLPEKIASAPYPRLRRLQEELRGAQSLADPELGYRFIHPATGRTVRLADIP